jgi:hypothetical protein
MRTKQCHAYVLLVCCFVVVAPSRLVAEERTLSVCELLSGLGRYRERIVRVRAVVAGGGQAWIVLERSQGAGKFLGDEGNHRVSR